MEGDSGFHRQLVGVEERLLRWFRVTWSRLEGFSGEHARAAGDLYSPSFNDGYRGFHIGRGPGSLVLKGRKVLGKKGWFGVRDYVLVPSEIILYIVPSEDERGEGITRKLATARFDGALRYISWISTRSIPGHAQRGIEVNESSVLERRESAGLAFYKKYSADPPVWESDSAEAACYGSGAINAQIDYAADAWPMIVPVNSRAESCFKISQKLTVSSQLDAHGLYIKKDSLRIEAPVVLSGAAHLWHRAQAAARDPIELIQQLTGKAPERINLAEWIGGIADVFKKTGISLTEIPGSTVRVEVVREP